MGAFARCVSGLRAVCRGLLLVSPAAIWQALSSGPSSGIHLLGLTWRAHLATGKRCLLPVVDIWEVTPVSNGRVELPTHPSMTSSLGGMVLSPAEAVSLALLARNSSPRCILEIGTASGGTTRLLALNAPDAVVHTLDLPPHETQTLLQGTDAGFIESRTVGVAFAGTREAARIVQHFGDSAEFDFGSIPSRVGLAFIDGSHSYEYVRSDTEKVLSVMAEDGIIVWHDYGGGVALGYGVTEYLAEIQRDLGVCLIRGTSLGVARLGRERPAGRLRRSRSRARGRA